MTGGHSSSTTTKLPTPAASSLVARRTMEANRRRDTRPERLLRSELHARGLRFRKDIRFEVEGRWVRPDVVFTRAQVAVFVDGCFWHLCPEHAIAPKANAAFWRAKLRRNVDRDNGDNAALAQAGWTVIRAWEHEPFSSVADRVQSSVLERLGVPAQSSPSSSRTVAIK